MRIPKLKDQLILDEVAMRRSELIKLIRDLEQPINDHLIKVLRWEDPVNQNKHLHDLDTWLNKIGRMKLKKGGSKLPSQKYFEYLFREPFTSPSLVVDLELNLKRRVFDRYRTLPVNQPSEKVLKELYRFHQWASKKLASIDDWQDLATRYFEENMK